MKHFFGRGAFFVSEVFFCWVVLIVDFNIILYYFCYVFLDSVQGLILRESFRHLTENAFHFLPRGIILM